LFYKKHKLLLAALTIMVMTAFLAGCGMVRVNPEVDNNTIVANVSGEEVKKEEFNKIFNIFKAQYEQQFGTEIWDQEIDGRKFGDVAKEKLLDMLVDEKLQLLKAKELGITVTDAEVNTEVDNAKKYFDSEEKFNEFLKGQSMDLDYFTQSVKKELTISKLVDKMTESISVTDEEVKTYYETNKNEFLSVKASHILLDTKEEAEKMLERVKAGEDFAELAKQYSKDPSAKENSGNLDYFRQGTMVEPFEKAAFALKPGEISDVVQTDFGFHIIKVEDSKLDNFDEVKEQLKSNMLYEKQNGEYEKLLEEMRNNTKIERFTKNLK
jgi:foldase protein PrsA